MLEQRTLLRSGEGGFHTYRIPSVIMTDEGTLLLFLEGRRHSSSDFGEIHLLVLRSEDEGATWSAPHVVWKEDTPGENTTIGNPCPVYDSETGTVWLTFTRNNERAFVTRSADDGRTWPEPREITGDVCPDDWTRYWTGPGHGLQLSLGPHAGRLVFPSYHNQADSPHTTMRCHMVISDDHGKTWRIGDSTTLDSSIEGDDLFYSADWVPGRCDWMGCECMAEETADGRLYLTVRNQVAYQSRKAYSWSTDGGDTWSPVRLQRELPGPACQSAIVRCSARDDGGGNGILFSGIAEGPRTKPGGRRSALTIFLSEDECETWPVSRVVHAGPAAYSDLVALPDGTALCVYEGGEEHPYESIRLARFGLGWVRGEEARRDAKAS